MPSLPVEAETLKTVAITLLTAITGGFGVMWRQQVAESKRKDQLIDKLVEQVMRTADGNTRIADAQMQLVSLQERERKRP